MELLPALGNAAATQDVPGASTAGGGKLRPSARTRCVALSPTNRCWAAATSEGLLLYSLDEALLFDPTDLTEDLTPASCHRQVWGECEVMGNVWGARCGVLVVVGG